jgi:hypothetical protein
MSLTTGKQLLLSSAAGAAAGYQISRSLRFNSSDSAYLSRTPASAGNRKTWTWAGWVKRSVLSSGYQTLFSGGSGAGRLLFGFGSGDAFSFELQGTGSHATTAVFRDPSAWYHVVVAFDTTQATAADRTKVWINNSLQSLFGLTFSQNTDYAINNNVEHRIGCQTSSVADFFNGYLADVHFIDGQALTPSSFTETDATTGQLIPKAYTGSYGTNGFRLSFSDNSGTTSTTLGKDAAGSNNWTPNNFSVSSGSGNDSLVDSPTGYGTDTGAGGEVRGNYCTINPLQNGGITLSNGNLDFTGVSGDRTAYTTFGVNSGKWYFEATVNTISTSAYATTGVTNTNNLSLTGQLGSTSTGWAILAGGGNTSSKYHNGSASSIGSWSTGTVYGIAFDVDAGKIWFSINGTFISSGNPATGANPVYSNLSGTIYPAVGSQSTSDSFSMNFGQRPFAYTAPSGFKALCTQNLPAPTITKPETVMDVKLYTGNGGNQTISGYAFSPDLVWIKQRSGTTDHGLFDTVRGVTLQLRSNTTAGDNVVSNALTSFTSDGYVLGGDGPINANGLTYVNWCWDAGSSTVTNTSGSISSQVRANASAGFSIVTYTGTGSNATVGHGLGDALGLVIVKCRSTANDWAVYHSANTSDPKTDYLLLNSTAATVDDNTYWNDTAPTSTVFSIGTNADVNTSSATYVAYCFAPVAGYSAFGSYTGNGSSDGPFVYCGFRPRWLLVKSVNYADTWVLIDAARETYNVMNTQLRPNSSNAESVAVNDSFDFLSNGFKIRGAGAVVNTSSAPFIYAAFAESPFAYARAR